LAARLDRRSGISGWRSRLDCCDDTGRIIADMAGRRTLTDKIALSILDREGVTVLVGPAILRDCGL